jgi:hypothetical protein
MITNQWLFLGPLDSGYHGEIQYLARARDQLSELDEQYAPSYIWHPDWGINE